MSDELLRVLLVEDNPGDAVLVEEMLLDADPDTFTLRSAESLLEGLDQLAQEEADVILLDLNLPDSQGLDTFLSMRVHAPGTPIVLLTGNDNDALALKAVEAGAQDYLVKDKLNGETLVHALRYAIVRHQSTPEQAAEEAASGAGRIVGVLGGKGGVGATTVAAHVAAQLRRQTGEPVLLADLDLDAGSVGFLMQVSSPYTIADAAANVHRLDGEFWRTLVPATAEGIDVILSPGLFGAGETPPEGRFRHLFRFLRKQYRWVVADLGRLNRLTATVVTETDAILLVTTADLMAVHDTGRVVEGLRSLDVPSDSLLLVHNQAGKWSSHSSVLESVLDLPVRFTLPACGNELSAACMKGELLGASTSFGRAIAAVSGRITGTEPEESRTSGFSLRRLSLFAGRESTQPQPAVSREQS